MGNFLPGDPNTNIETTIIRSDKNTRGVEISTLSSMKRSPTYDDLSSYESSDSSYFESSEKQDFLGLDNSHLNNDFEILTDSLMDWTATPSNEPNISLLETKQPSHDYFSSNTLIDSIPPFADVNFADINFGKDYVSSKLNYLERLKPVDQFTVVFRMDAVVLIKELGYYLEVHSAFRDKIENLTPIDLPEFDRIFEKRLAMYISLNIRNRSRDSYMLMLDGCYTIMIQDVINEMSVLIHDIINRSYGTFPNEASISYMLSGYPTKLLSQICDTNMLNAYLMGESMRQFIIMRRTYPRFMPPELRMSTISNYPLVGDAKSPVNDVELEALYRYLGSRKRLYVVMLLNCLHELKEHGKYLKTPALKIEEMILICKSGWFTLFLSAVNMNSEIKVIPCVTSKSLPESPLSLLESPLSLLESPLSLLESPLSLFESLKSSLESPLSLLESQQSFLESQQSSLES
ncbi:Hypothetical protein HVR_LOCUS1259 [uncultured virus]|nr:Hypothetical protein HVR_LOCUS1259 [uncultured virus]